MRVEAWIEGGIFQGQASIDAAGVFVPTEAQGVEGVQLSYKGEWGYHPLVVSFANTNEPLFLVNGLGARPSHEDAAKYLTKAAQLCLSAGFTEVLLGVARTFHKRRILMNGMKLDIALSSEWMLGKISGSLVVQFQTGSGTSLCGIFLT